MFYAFRNLQRWVGQIISEASSGVCVFAFGILRSARDCCGSELKCSTKPNIYGDERHVFYRRFVFCHCKDLFFIFLFGHRCVQQGGRRGSILSHVVTFSDCLRKRSTCWTCVWDA